MVNGFKLLIRTDRTLIPAVVAAPAAVVVGLAAGGAPAAAGAAAEAVGAGGRGRWGRWRLWWWRRWRWWRWRRRSGRWPGWNYDGRPWWAWPLWLRRLALQLNLYPHCVEPYQPRQFRPVQRHADLPVLRVAEQRGAGASDGVQREIQFLTYLAWLIQ